MSGFGVTNSRIINLEVNKHGNTKASLRLPLRVYVSVSNYKNESKIQQGSQILGRTDLQCSDYTDEIVIHTHATKYMYTKKELSKR
jgi:hypothetical protein